MADQRIEELDREIDKKETLLDSLNSDIKQTAIYHSELLKDVFLSSAKQDQKLEVTPTEVEYYF
jgi:hypothetical protein